jgi:small-conductance mechanosensitive channel
MRASTRQLFLTVARVGVYTVTALVALNTLGIDLTAFAIFGGAIGVGIGFGLQKIASNFLSGLILLLERSVQVNDMIEMYNGDVSGIVKHTGARYTLVETFDNRKILIPNDDFITQRVTNWTYSNTRGLIKIPVNVGYGSDLEKAQALMLEAALENPRCLQDPPPRCLLQSFGDLAVSFTLSVWLSDIREKRFTMQSELLLAIWRKFTDHNIGLPHQNREMHYNTLHKANQPEENA